MADISKIQIESGTYNIKDSIARNLVNDICINVKDYGAKGDNSTDDTTAFVNALSYLDNLGGGTLFIPVGIYLISDTIVVPSNVTIQGVGKSSVIKASNFNNEPVYKTMLRNDNFQMITENNNCENIVIKDLFLDNNNDPNAGHDGLIQFRGLIKSSIENVEINVRGNNCWGILLFSANKDININNVSINNTSVDNSLGGCLWIRSGLISYGNDNKKSYGIHVSNSYFTSTAKDELIAVTDGVAGGWTECSITNCTLIGKATTNYSSFLICMNCVGDNTSKVKCELNNLNLQGDVLNAAVMAGYSGSTLNSSTLEIVANNLIINLAHGTSGVQSIYKEQVYNNCLIKIPSASNGAYNCTITNSRIYNKVTSCNVINCYINTGSSGDACCSECEKVIGSELHTTGSGITIYGKRTAQFLNNQIYADYYGIRSSLNPSNEGLENSIISGNYLRRENNSSNAGSIGINTPYIKNSQMVNNRIMGVAGNAVGAYYGFNYALSVSNASGLTQTENNTSFYPTT